MSVHSWSLLFSEWSWWIPPSLTAEYVGMQMKLSLEGVALLCGQMGLQILKPRVFQMNTLRIGTSRRKQALLPQGDPFTWWQRMRGWVTITKWFPLSFPVRCFSHSFPVEDRDFSGGSDGKESACNAGNLSSIPGLGRPPGKGNGCPLQYSCME